MTDLGKLAGPWWPIIGKFDRGEGITKAELLGALGSRYPVPDEAKTLITAVVTGELKFKGHRHKLAQLALNVDRQMALEMVELAEAALADQPRLRGGLSRKAQAQKIVADILGVSVSTLQHLK